MAQKENGRPRYEEVAKFRVANLQYTSWGGLAASVQLAEKKEKNLVVPARVEYRGLTYLVSELGFDSFKNDTLLRVLAVQCEADTLNVLKGSFKGCSRLKQVYLMSNKLVGIGNEIWPCNIDQVFDTHHFNDVSLFVPASLVASYKRSVWGRFKHIEAIDVED